MARTYLPHLVFLARLLSKYCARWYEQLSGNTTAAQLQAIDGVTTAIQGLLAEIQVSEED